MFAPVKVTYLILALEQPELSGRQAFMISHPKANCFVHINQTAVNSLFQAVLAGFQTTLTQHSIKVVQVLNNLVRAGFDSYRVVCNFYRVPPSGLPSNRHKCLSIRTEIFHEFRNRCNEDMLMQPDYTELSRVDPVSSRPLYDCSNGNMPFNLYRIEHAPDKIGLPRRHANSLAIGWSQRPFATTVYKAHCSLFLPSNSWMEDFFGLPWSGHEVVFQAKHRNYSIQEKWVNGSLANSDRSDEKKTIAKTRINSDDKAKFHSGVMLSSRFHLKTETAVIKLQRHDR